jgi:hypothetical protein
VKTARKANLLPFLTEGATPVPRKLFWRCKANPQRVVPDGDMKYLKIIDNTFLFNALTGHNIAWGKE